MTNTFLFYARPDLVALIVKIHTFLGTKMQEPSADLTPFCPYQPQCLNRALTEPAQLSSGC